MTYKINGTELTLQPTTGRWIPRKSIGIDGNGHAVYPGVREFEMTFILSAPDDFNQLQTFYESVYNTGTVVVDLPWFAHDTYTFRSYTGCLIQEPSQGVYFTEHQKQIRLLVTNIRT